MIEGETVVMCIFDWCGVGSARLTRRTGC